jgi:hypothetical protein
VSCCLSWSRFSWLPVTIKKRINICHYFNKLYYTYSILPQQLQVCDHNQWDCFIVNSSTDYTEFKSLGHLHSI